MSTQTTNLKLIKPELTDPADITVLNTNWDKIDEVFGGMGLKSSVVEVTLTVSGWSGANYVWRNDKIISATQIIELVPSPNITTEQLEALQGANIVGTSQEVGKVTLTAYGDVPRVAIPVIFILRGDV